MTYWKEAKAELVRPAERKLLVKLAQETVARFDLPTIVNIGVSWGGSVHCLRAGAPGARLVAIDLDYEKRPVQRADLLDGVEFVQADSGRYAFEGAAHLVFVDGDHSYEAVRDDIKNWIKHIPIGGIAAFHDYAPSDRDRPRLEGVRRAVDEWRQGAGWDCCGQANSVIAFRRIK